MAGDKESHNMFMRVRLIPGLKPRLIVPIILLTCYALSGKYVLYTELGHYLE
jgi:hypothetical protein